MRKKWMAAALGAAMLLGAWGCSSDPETTVYVQNVGEITGYGTIAANDKFAGVVVSEKVTEIQRDGSREVSKLYVSEGQNVNQGDVLFEYDSEAMDLELSKQNLELERLQNNATTLKSQLTELEKGKKNASKDEEANWTLSIQAKETEIKENEYSIKVKKKEIEQLKNTLTNAEVLSPVPGRVVSINESGYDQYGNSQAYITIQQSGSFRVKGTINELNMGVIMEGSPIRITSRTDPTQSWTGTVTLIDLESAAQGGNSNGMYMGGMETNEMTGSSKYPFYVELDNTEGLMLGQHVYLELDAGENPTGTGLWLPEYYICYDETEEGDAGETASAYVWAANSKDRLEKRYVTLGAYDEMRMAYEILDGLTVEDYIAFPDATCMVGAGTTTNMDEATPVTGDDPTGEEFGPMDNPEEGQDGIQDFEPGEDGGDIDGSGGDGDFSGSVDLPVSSSSGSVSGTASSGNLGGSDIGTASGGNLGG